MTIKGYAMDLLHKVSKLMIKMMMRRRKRIIRMMKSIRRKLNLLGRI